METEPIASGGNRPRPILLVLLGVAVLALALVKLMPSGSVTPGRATLNQPRPPAAGGGRVDPQDLDVRLETLSAARPAQGTAERNPFRFAPKVQLPSPETVQKTPTAKEGAPPPPPPSETCGDGLDNDQDGVIDNGCGPPPPPPIPLKFIGIIEGQGKKLAALSDCKFTYRGEEGEIIDGRYRLVKIGVESIVMEYVDGRGRITIRLSGQDCVGR